MIKLFAPLLILALLAGCSSRKAPSIYDNGEYKDTISQKNYSHPTMKPYTVRGKRYYPTVVSVGERYDGIASWYGPKFHGKLTSNGETYDMYDKTAAHKTLPMNTVVRVTNTRNNRSSVVRINDRGPFIDSRIIDLSKTVASELDMVKTGTAPVRLEILGFADKGEKRINIAALKKGPRSQVLGSYSVQIGSFSRFEGARFTQEKYDNTDGYRTKIKDTEYNGQRLFRVWLSGFESEAEARDYIASGRFEHAFIVRD